MTLLNGRWPWQDRRVGGERRVKEREMLKFPLIPRPLLTSMRRWDVWTNTYSTVHWSRQCGWLIQSQSTQIDVCLDLRWHRRRRRRLLRLLPLRLLLRVLPWPPITVYSAAGSATRPSRRCARSGFTSRSTTRSIRRSAPPAEKSSGQSGSSNNIKSVAFKLWLHLLVNRIHKIILCFQMDHGGERPYPCPECAFTCKTKQQLNEHRRKHSVSTVL